MKTITFYSYKGGVGRSLALSNIATRLSEFKKNVCVLDFDLEAPGMHFKFKKYKNTKKIDRGIVDYIHEFSSNGIIPKTIKDYSFTYYPSNKLFRPIYLIPAGNIDDSIYWEKLSKINWGEMFYSEKGQGIPFFLDIKAKIEKEFNPDILLIDSRTGITNMSGVTLKIMADEVVILSANNEENIYGSKKIMQNLLDPENSINEIKIHFVLTRLPFNESSEDRIKESRIIDRIKRDFKLPLNVHLDINVIHSDRRLEENEQLLIGDEYEEKAASISNDYLKLFDKLTKDILSEDEIKKFKIIKAAAHEFLKSQDPNLDNSTKIQHLDKAIELDHSNTDYLYKRSAIYFSTENFEKAIKDLKRVLELQPNNSTAYNDIGAAYSRLNKHEEAIIYYDKALNINPNYLLTLRNKSVTLNRIKGREGEALNIIEHILANDPTNDRALNTRAEIYRKLGEYNKAYSDIFKAIEQNPNEPMYFGTLAEIFSAEGKTEEFYHNLNIALSIGITGKIMNSAKEVYQKYVNVERFINLIEKYGIELDEIFA